MHLICLLFTLLCCIVATTKVTDDEVDDEDLKVLYGIPWSYLTPLPGPGVNVIYKNYKFGERHPWSGMVCPKGSFISKIAYNFIVSLDSFKDIPNEELSPWQMGLKERYWKMMDMKHKMEGLINATEKERLHEEVQYDLDQWVELKERFYKKPGPHNTVTQITYSQEVVTNIFILRMRLKLAETQKLYTDEDLLGTTMESDVNLTLSDKLFFVLCKNNTMNIPVPTLCNEDNDTHQRRKYLRELNTDYGDAEGIEGEFNLTESVPGSGDTYPVDFGPCGSLIHCVGHQACLLRFSNDFCLNDPFPGFRKFLNITLTCEKEDMFTGYLRNMGVGSDLKVHTHHNISTLPETVMYPMYLPVNQQGSTQYNTTNIDPQYIKEEEVFQKECPSLQEATRMGYWGNCTLSPDPEGASQILWTSLGRSPDDECREQLYQVFCAYAYDPTGHCVPPVLSAKAKDGSPRFGYKSIPTPGKRYNVSTYRTIYNNKHMSLIPVRIGFLFVVHGNPQYLVELLKLIYRPEHYYVYHVDYRQDETRMDLTALISLVFPEANNIRVLPKERSFVASWGSYQIMRAELEGFEELLRMGVWDFAVILSGSDLPLREIEDLAAGLAPYRGHIFLRVNKGSPTYDQNNAMIWYSCGGHTYTVGGRVRGHREVYSHSAWVVLSREFLEEILAEDRSEMMTDLQFFLQTSVIPDESYLGGLIFKSRYRSLLVATGIHLMGSFHGETADHLCRHSHESDGCGKGPKIFEMKDVSRLIQGTSSYFFARKFALNSSDNTRQAMLNALEQDMYHVSMSDYYTETLLKALAEYAWGERLEATHAGYSVSELTNWRLLPMLAPKDPCCPCDRDIFFEQFRVWIDFTMKNEAGETLDARASLVPRLPHTCIPDSHLAAIQVSTRFHEGPPKRTNVPILGGIPIPTSRAEGKNVFVNLFVQLNSTSDEKCKEKAQTLRGVNLAEPGRSTFGAVLKNRKGDIYGQSVINLAKSHKGLHSHKRFTIDSMRMGLERDLAPGQWTVTLTQLGVDDPIIYNQSVWLTDSDPQKQEEQVLKNIKSLYDVEDAMVLNQDFDKYYTNIEIDSK